MAISKRKWTTAKGEAREAWIAGLRRKTSLREARLCAGWGRPSPLLTPLRPPRIPGCGYPESPAAVTLNRPPRVTLNRPPRPRRASGIYYHRPVATRARGPIRCREG